MSKAKHKKSSSGKSFLVIVSRGAGGVKLRREEFVIKNSFQKKGAECDVLEIDRSQHPINKIDLKGQLSKKRYKALVVAGGDGTLRAVIEECYHQQLKIPVGFIPRGSANITAWVFKIPLMLDRAVTRLILAEPKKIPLAIVNNKHIYFLSACFGRWAEVVVQAEYHHKRIIGPWAYLVTIFRYGMRFKRQSVAFKIDDGQWQTTQAHSVLTFLPATGAIIAPKMFNPGPGLLQVMLVRNITFLQFLWGLIQIYILRQKSALAERFCCNQLEVKGDFGKHVHLDGDMLDKAETVYHFKVLPKALSLIY